MQKPKNLTLILPVGEQDEDEDALKTANYLNFLGKLGQYPKVHFTMYPRTKL